MTEVTWVIESEYMGEGIDIWYQYGPAYDDSSQAYADLSYLRSAEEHQRYVYRLVEITREVVA